jgi:RNA polymerase sigma-70 factor, ECF subfamily
LSAVLEDRLKALMVAGQGGDIGAWRELLSALGRQLRSYFARRMDAGGAADVEDLVQETLMAIHRRRMTYDATQPFTAWAYAVARYKLIDFWRRSKTRKNVPIDDVADWLEGESTTEDGAVRADLNRVLSVLPERQQTLVRDVKIEGLSLAEAGARMGISEGAAKVALHRAMKILTEGARGT